ncbi:hypothetical protein AAFC00_006088 [Neodothiora populina]|uniref:Zn(2)-C6 fungal-type domain-containing protein n=1 Tax=Neodothiora populina TaxID=2781224 RepID=A0ABR3P757_9PEZI
MDDEQTKPRARVKNACEECRKGKRKCDGAKPTCFLCQRSGRTCLYIPETSRKRKYQDEELIRNLQDQINTLQNALLEARSSNEHDRSFADPSRALAHEHEGIGQERSTSSDLIGNTSFDDYEGSGDSPYIRSSAAIEELSSLMLKVQIEDRGEPSFTISSIQSTVPDSHSVSQAGPKANVRELNTSLSTSSNHELRQHLVACFMDEFNVYHRFLDSEDANLLVNGSEGENELDAHFRNNALFAVASFFSGQQHVRLLEENYYSNASNLALQCIASQPSDLVIQGLALLGWRDLMLGAHSMAYNWIAMATGQVLHLGLHVTALTSPDSSFAVHSSAYKRRVRSFSAYFSVDRLVTSSLGMNCTMHWQRVRQPSFLSILPGAPGVDDIAHDRFCELWHLWDSCMDQTYAFGWAQLDRKDKTALVLRSHQSLVKFNSENDEALRLSKGYMPDSVVWLQLSYQTSLILIHRPLLDESGKSPAGRFAIQSVTTAAATITKIVRAYRRLRSFTSISPQIIDYILTAAVIHLLNATAGRTPLGRRSANGVRICVDALYEMQDRWGHRARAAFRRIQELAHKWEVVWTLPIAHSGPLSNPREAAKKDATPRVDPGFASHAIRVDDGLDHIALHATIESFWEDPPLQHDDDLASAIQGMDASYLDWLFDNEGPTTYNV